MAFGHNGFVEALVSGRGMRFVGALVRFGWQYSPNMGCLFLSFASPPGSWCFLSRAALSVHSLGTPPKKISKSLRIAILARAIMARPGSGN